MILFVRVSRSYDTCSKGLFTHELNVCMSVQVKYCVSNIDELETHSHAVTIDTKLKLTLRAFLVAHLKMSHLRRPSILFENGCKIEVTFQKDTISGGNVTKEAW